MKAIIILCPIIALIAAGCDMGEMDFDFSWGDPYYPWTPDSSAVSSVLLRLSADTVYYEPGSVAEVSGYGEVRNFCGQALIDVPLGFCLSDSTVACIWDDGPREDTTDANGRASFTLRCKDCAGDVKVRIMDGWSTKHVVFLPTDRIPARLTVSATPETLYFNAQHPGSLTLRAAVSDGNDRPIRGFRVRSDHLSADLPDCYSGSARADAQGIVAVSKVYAYSPMYTYTHCFTFSAGSLQDSICVTFMPWDSSRGG